MKPNYTVIIYTPQELNHSSYIQTGLFELKRQGAIEVKVEVVVSKRLGKITIFNDGKLLQSAHAQPKTSYYELINNQTNKSVLFATDLYDFSNVFSSDALETCDIIFKRNFEKKYINALPIVQQKKLFKLGLTFGVHSEFKKSESLFKLGLFLSNLNVNLKFDRLLINRLLKTFYAQKKHWGFISTSRKIIRFESYNEASKNTILFQTRCFSSEAQADVLGIHKQRYDIIKLLRKKFPNEFNGGFISSELAREKYADALSNVPSNPEVYLDVLKSSRIVIYTRGLVNSPAWKMAEYLSQGKIIIAEPLTAELPVPLVHGKEVLFFNSDQELIENIELVLTNKELGKTLSKNARDYFEKHVHPTQNVQRILDLMIANFNL